MHQKCFRYSELIVIVDQTSTPSPNIPSDCQGLMASGGGTTSPNLRKTREKNGKCNQYDILQVLSKSSWITFKTILKTLSALGACYVTIIWKICSFWEYLCEFFIFFHGIFFGRKFLPNSKSQFWPFLTIFGIFRPVYFVTSLWSRSLIFYQRLA